MDPLTALGVASNIVQFVDFTRELISTAYDLYKSSSGTGAENFELEVLVRGIQQRAVQISSPRVFLGATLNAEDKALEELSQQCQVLASELLSVLRSLKVEGRHVKWKSFYQALRSMKNKTYIENLQRRLDRISSHVNSHTILRQQSDVLEMLQILQDENARLDSTRVKDIADLKDLVTKLFKEMSEGGKRESLDDDIARQLSLTSEKGIKLSAEQRILKFLRFDSMNYRYRGVQTAHEGTFTWIKDPTTFTPDTQASDSFTDWLKSNDSMYWISGKIGAGKSTLMKYLCEQEIVRNSLQLWAGQDSKLVLASFFLWKAGKLDLQKSQAGLLRHIMYQVLCQCPDLIPYAYPEQWEWCITSDYLRADDFGQSYLTVLELLAALQRVTESIMVTKFRFCFFIDGLDEYDGKPEDIIKLVELLRVSNHVKMCVSSRPWNEFEKAFGGNDVKQLRIQDLTHKDIELYVRDTLEKDVSFQELAEDDDGCTELVKEVVSRANGVFLWVRLVVQSLLEGATNADRIIDLRKRLQSFPSDLYGYFERELLSIDKLYRRGTARFFQVTLDACDLLPLMSYWFVDQDENEHVMKIETEPWPIQRTNNRLKRMKKRLNACCKGLLELQLHDDSDYSNALSSSVLFDLRVEFSHRSVRDFLETTDIQTLLSKWLGAGFDANIVVCEAILGQIKTSPRGREYSAEQGPIYKLSLIFWAQVEASRNDTYPTPYLKSLSRELVKTIGVDGHEVAEMTESMTQMDI